MTPAAASPEIAKIIKIIRLARHVGYVRNRDGKWAELMSPQAFQITLEVAQNSGLTVKQLMTASGLSHASVHRNIMALGDWHRKDMPGLGLVEAVDDPRDYRRKVVFLTAKGRKFVSEIVSIQIGGRVKVEFLTAYEHINKPIAETESPQ